MHRERIIFEGSGLNEIGIDSETNKQVLKIDSNFLGLLRLIFSRVIMIKQIGSLAGSLRLTLSL